MSSNAKTAGASLDELKRPIKELRQEFLALTKDQRQATLVNTMRQQEQAAEDANGAYSEFLTTVRQQLGTSVGTRIASEFDNARKSGKGLTDTLNSVQKRFNIPDNQMANMRLAAGAVSTLDDKTALLNNRLAMQRKELDSTATGQKDKTETDIAATNAGNNYLQTLEKQRNTLKDKTALEAADRFITENKIDSQSDLAKKIRDTARSIDSQKEADKAATQSTKDATSAQSKLKQQLDAAAESFKQLKLQFDPAGAAADEFLRKRLS